MKFLSILTLLVTIVAGMIALMMGCCGCVLSIYLLVRYSSSNKISLPTIVLAFSVFFIIAAIVVLGLKYALCCFSEPAHMIFMAGLCIIQLGLLVWVTGFTSKFISFVQTNNITVNGQTLFDLDKYVSPYIVWWKLAAGVICGIFWVDLVLVIVNFAVTQHIKHSKDNTPAQQQPSRPTSAATTGDIESQPRTRTRGRSASAGPRAASRGRSGSRGRRSAASIPSLITPPSSSIESDSSESAQESSDSDSSYQGGF